MRTLLFALLVCAALSAQTTLPSYVAFREASLTAAGEVVSIQQPVSPTKTVNFEGASVYCSAACDVTIERDGTAATTTALTVAPVATDTIAGSALAFHTSNVGSGTVLAKHAVAAGEIMSFELKGMRLPRIAGKNVTIRVSSITGTARVLVKWTETN